MIQRQHLPDAGRVLVEQIHQLAANPAGVAVGPYRDLSELAGRGARLLLRDKDPGLLRCGRRNPGQRAEHRRKGSSHARYYAPAGGRLTIGG